MAVIPRIFAQFYFSLTHIISVPNFAKMPRLIFTFLSINTLLAAQKALEKAPQPLPCRVTPTPVELEIAICGMSLEILSLEDKNRAIEFLASANLSPAGIHEVD